MAVQACLNPRVLPNTSVPHLPAVILRHAHCDRLIEPSENDRPHVHKVYFQHFQASRSHSSFSTAPHRRRSKLYACMDSRSYGPGVQNSIIQAPKNTLGLQR